MFDLVPKGGRVIAPAQGWDARLDVAFADGKVAELGLRRRHADARCLAPDRGAGTALEVAEHAGPPLMLRPGPLGEKLISSQRLACHEIVPGGR